MNTSGQDVARSTVAHNNTVAIAGYTSGDLFSANGETALVLRPKML